MRPRRRTKLVYSPAPQLSLDPFRSHSRGTCSTCFVLLRQDLRTPMRIIYALFLSAAAVFFVCAATAQQTEKRIALVVGNAAYQAEALPTAANDAGLIAQTLQAAGFDVVGARDLDQDALRR